MKEFSSLAEDILEKDQTPMLVHAVHSFSELRFLESPIISSKIKCPMCEGTKGMHSLIDPKTSLGRMWFCVDRECLKNYPRIYFDSVKNEVVKRVIEWKDFCEANGLGDLDYDICFEKIKQSKAKIDFLYKFSKNPQGILIMRGPPGTGKTYATLGLCELFTRSSGSCVFITQKIMDYQFQESFRNHNAYDNRSRLSQINLLVIDDFGLTEPSSGFLSYLKEIIDIRMKWSNRGTVITTNLEEKALSLFSGDALSDRLKIGQLFLFEGQSRRERKVL